MSFLDPCVNISSHVRSLVMTIRDMSNQDNLSKRQPRASI